MDDDLMDYEKLAYMTRQLLPGHWSQRQWKRLTRHIISHLLKWALGVPHPHLAISHEETADPDLIALCEDMEAVLKRYGKPEDETQYTHLAGDLTELMYDYHKRKAPCMHATTP